MTIKINELLRELSLRVPVKPDCAHIVWVSEESGKLSSIDFNRPWDSIHGQVSDEVGYYLNHSGTQYSILYESWVSVIY